MTKPNLRNKFQMAPSKFPGVGVNLIEIEDTRTLELIKVQGKGAHIDAALKRFGWDGSSPVATCLITTEEGSVEGCEWILRGNLGCVKTPLRRVQGPTRSNTNLAGCLDLTDLSRFQFPTVTVPLSEAKNHSDWHTGTDFLSMLEYNGRKITEESGIRSDPFITERGFCLR